jgi:hypothetical protein
MGAHPSNTYGSKGDEAIISPRKILDQQLPSANVLRCLNVPVVVDNTLEITGTSLIQYFMTFELDSGSRTIMT